MKTPGKHRRPRECRSAVRAAGRLCADPGPACFHRERLCPCGSQPWQERGSAGLGAPGRVPDPGCVFGLPQGTVELRTRTRRPPRGRGPRRSPGDRGRDGHAAFSSAGVTRALTNEAARGWHARSVCLRPGAGRLRKCTWTYFSNLGPRTSGPLPALVQNPWRTCFLGG